MIICFVGEKTLITRFDKIKLKPTTKTSTKVFKLPVNPDLFYEKDDLNQQELFYGNTAILALQEAFTKHEAHNGR